MGFGEGARCLQQPGLTPRGREAVLGACGAEGSLPFPSRPCHLNATGPLCIMHGAACASDPHAERGPATMRVQHNQ